MDSDTRRRIDDRLKTEETGELISSEKVDGTVVYNRKGDHLGTVHHLMINKITGQVVYAVMSFGGFLGIGESYHPLPWSALDYDPDIGGYVIDTNREELEKAPRYTASDQPDWSDQGYTRRIDVYWIRRV